MTDYNQLLVVRGLMGLGFGGEYAAGAVLLSESMRADRRGKALGIMSTGFAVGWGVAALLFIVFSATMNPDIAWRALLILGIIPIFVFW